MSDMDGTPVACEIMMGSSGMVEVEKHRWLPHTPRYAFELIWSHVEIQYNFFI